MLRVRYTSVAVLLLSGAIVAAFVTFPRTRLAAQPPSTADAQQHSRAVYESRCVECYGPAGRGDGPSAWYLMPRPRDFGTGKYKIRTTESGSELHRVRVGGFADRAAAVDVVRQLEAKGYKPYIARGDQ